MRWWWTQLVCGMILAAGPCVLAEEEDPFVDLIPVEPVAVQPELTEPSTIPPAAPEPVTPPPPLPSDPLPSEPALIIPETTPARAADLHVFSRVAEPSEAQKRVHEKAAREALARKARIEQRRYGVPALSPSGSWQVQQSLYAIDPGIRVAFRPIDLSGLAPLPSVNGASRPRTKAVAPRNAETTPRR